MSATASETCDAPPAILFSHSLWLTLTKTLLEKAQVFSNALNIFCF